MRPVTRWQHLMSSAVVVAPKTGMDNYGKPTYGTAVTYRGHISQKRQLVRTATGQQVESRQQVHLATVDAILPTAKVTLSTGDVGSTEATVVSPVIQAIERRADQIGPHHTVIFF